MTGASFYLPIHLSDVIRPETVGVFVPEHLQMVDGAIDVIVYFHGNIIEACGTDPDKFLEHGIAYYWDTPLFRCLRDDLAVSGVNAILVAPTLSTKFGSSDASWTPRYGNLNKDGQFDMLLAHVIAELRINGALPAGTKVGKIVLAAHSAGGLPMMRILQAKNWLSANISECWGFECLYFGTDAWSQWLSTFPDKQFMHFSRASEMSHATTWLKKWAGFRDMRCGKEHCTLVRDNWRVVLASSAVLKQVPVPAVEVPVVVASVAPAAKRQSFWDFVRSIGRG